MQFKGTNTFSQLEIPIGFMYDKTLGKKWSVLPSLSANLGFITQKSGYTLDYQMLNVTPLNGSWFRKSYASATASFGIYRNFTNQVKLGVSASGNYMLTQMYIPGATIKPRAFTTGLSTQLIWRLTQ